jgi:hypothetical protein
MSLKWMYLDNILMPWYIYIINMFYGMEGVVVLFSERETIDFIFLGQKQLN